MEEVKQAAALCVAKVVAIQTESGGLHVKIFVPTK